MTNWLDRMEAADRAYGGDAWGLNGGSAQQDGKAASDTSDEPEVTTDDPE